MPTTPGGIITPSAVDPPDVPADMLAMAESIETGLAWLTSGITAASGWTMVSQERKLVGSTVFFRINATKATSGITITSASGSAGASTVAVMPAGYIPTVLQGGITSVNAGRGCAGYVDTSGNIVLAYVMGTANIAVSDTITLGGAYNIG